MRYRFAEILPYRVHPSSTDGVNLKIQIARGCRVLLKQHAPSGRFRVVYRGGVIIGLMRNGESIDCEHMTESKLGFYVRQPFSKIKPSPEFMGHIEFDLSQGEVKSSFLTTEY